MRQFPRTPTQSFLLASGIIIAVVVGVGIPLGLTGTYEQPSWMPRGTGIDMPSPSENVFRPEMVIITSNAFKSTLEPLAQWKTQKGTPCVVNTTEEIYAHYSGRDNAEKIRNFLKAVHTNGSLKWVLLGGDDNVVPLRYVFNDDVDQVNPVASETPSADRQYKPTDYYYSDLTGDWDTDKDNRFGERPTNTPTGVDEVDWTPEVYVGRFPANEQGELQNLVEKTLEYEKNPLNDTWMNDFLLGGAVADSSPYNDEGLVVQNITASYVPSSMDVTMSLDSSGNLSSFEAAFDAGKSLVHFQGHGSTSSLANYASSFFYTSDALNLNNQYKPALMFAAACSTGAFDVSGSDTLMEALLFRQYEGVIGYVGSFRVDWYFDLIKEDMTNNRFNSLNRGMARYFWRDFFSGGLHQPGKALADMKVSYIHSQWFKSPGWGDLDIEYERKNLFTYTLWGDPELSVYTAQVRAFGDPLPPAVYAGQRLQAVIKYNNSEYIVPGATVCIQSGDFYYTSHVTGGAFDVRLALDPRTYNMTITGPNMQPYNTTFTTVLDTTGPQIAEVEEAPPAPGYEWPVFTVNDALSFGLRATDSESGLGAAILHVSYDNFKTFANFSLTKDGNTNRYNATLLNLPPGDMQYYFTVMDYAENSTQSPLTYSMHIDPLFTHFGIAIMGIGAATLMGIAISASMVKRWRAWKQYIKINGERSPELLESKKEEVKNQEFA